MRRHAHLCVRPTTTCASAKHAKARHPTTRPRSRSDLRGAVARPTDLGATVSQLSTSLFLGEPLIVVLLGPIEIDLTRTHRFERAFHAERADIDVRDDHCDKHNGDEGMHHLRDLHSRDARHVKGKSNNSPHTKKGGAAP